MEIAQSWDARKVVGVDIDDGLIRAAWKRRRTVWSLQAPTQELDSERPVKRPRRTSTIANYFPASFEHSFGPLSIPPATPNTANKFPHNIAFFTSDWVHNPIPTDKDSYDVVLAFSISKWIHLNGGDDAIIKIFNRVYTVLNHGGVFVLEPQAWETYGKARKMDEKLRTNAKTLKLRPKDFEAKLQEIGFGPAKHLGVAGQGGECPLLVVYHLDIN